MPYEFLSVARWKVEKTGIQIIPNGTPPLLEAEQIFHLEFA